MNRFIAVTTVYVSGVAMLVLLLTVAYAGTDVQINSDPPGDVQNEIRMTRNPNDLSNFLVAYNDKSGAPSSPLGISFSLNGGLTWSDRQLSVPTHPFLGTPDDGISLGTIFDPFIDSDSQGNIYAGYIATDGTLGGPGGIYIERSQDKGQSWSGPTNIDFNTRATPPSGPDPSFRFNDRPDMTVDSSDNAYVVWIKDVDVGQPTSDIYFAKSGPPGTPGPTNPTGLDFTGLTAGSVAPQTVNDNPGGTPGGSDFANVPTVAVAPDGTVYVAWIDVDVTNPSPKTGKLMIDISSNGGATFGLDVTAQVIDGVANPHTALASHLSTTSGAGNGDDARSGSYPVIAVDPSSSKTVYMVYAADPTDAAGLDYGDIFFTKSLNGGLTWTIPMRLNDDSTTKDQFHPDMAVKADGTIDVVWYDKRNSSNDDSWDVYIAKSTDGGASFSTNLRITDKSFATPDNSISTEKWMGEYLGLVVDSSFAYVAFTSSINDSKGDVFFDSVANSAIGGAKGVDIDIKPGSDPNAINPKSRGKIPVAILSTTDFDATSQVDKSSLTFGRTGDEDSLSKCTKSNEDVNGDGLDDVVCHFNTQDTGFQQGDTEGIVKGNTLNGVPIEGKDSVRIVK